MRTLREYTPYVILATLALVAATIFIYTVGSEAWRKSERATAYNAYIDCLRTMSGRPVDVIEMFCGKIKDRL